MLTEIKRLQKLAGLLKESDGEYEYNALMDVVDDMFDPQTEPEMHNRLTRAVEDAFNKGNLDLMGLDTEIGKAHRTVEMIAQNAGIDLGEDGDLSWDSMKADEQLEEGENLSPLDFKVGDDVWVNSLNTSAVVVSTEVENEEQEGEDVIIVQLWNKQGEKEQMVVHTSDVEKLDDSEGNYGDHYGDDEDDASYYTRRGWQSKMDEVNGKAVPFTPKHPKKKGVDINDFEDEYHGDLDSYVSKLVSQELNKGKGGKTIPFTPKK